MTLTLVFVLALASGEPPRSGPWPPEGYACLRATSPPVIDGRLDEAAWDAAPWTGPFVDIEGDRRPVPSHATRARMLWDEEFFYVAAELEEPHLWATLRERDSVIYHDNDFEVFLDPDGDSHLYTEIELNAFNTVWDLLLVRPYRDGGPAIHAWDIPGLRSAVHLDGTINDPSDSDRGWTVEIAIPFAVIAETTRAACPPRPGDRWRVNFSRVQWKLETGDDGYTKEVDPATGRPLAEDNWVWSAQREIAMHEPEHWGIVEFRTVATNDPVRPTPTDAAQWHLRNASYRLEQLKNDSGRYPESIGFPERPLHGPRLDPGWRWPPSYVSDGRRYELTISSQTTEVRLTEDGRLTVEEPR
jgi:hypothetical protein